MDAIEIVSEKPGEYSYDDAVEMTGHGRYNYLLLAACCVIANAMAVDMYGFSVIVAAGTCDLQLSIAQTGLMTSIPLAGIIFAFPWGYYADTQGRRRALLLSTAVGSTLAALSSLAPTWQAMLALKFLGCIFSTASFSLTMTYLGECTGRLRRSRYIFIMNSANLAAELLFYSLAYFVLQLDFKLLIPWLSIIYRPWRLYALILAAPLGLGALMMLFLHESPKFLASRGQTDEALRVLNAMYKSNGGKEGEYQVKYLSANNIGEPDATVSFWSSVVQQTMPLFRPPLVWRTLQLFYLMIICCSTNNVFLMWYPMMVNLFFNSFTEVVQEDISFCQRVVSNISNTAVVATDYICDDTISSNTIYSGIILGLVFASLNLVAALVASWRRLVLISLLLTSALCLVLVNLVRNPVGNMVVFTLVQITAVGVSCVASYFVDLYPTNYRGMATSLGAMVSRLVSLGGVNLTGAVIVGHCTLTFYVWAGIVGTGIMAALFLPPDRNRHLR